MGRAFGKSKAKAALARVTTVNATLPVDAEQRISALELVDHWHTNKTQLDKVRGYGNFTFFSDGRGLSFIQKDVDYTLTTSTSGIVCDATLGNITLTLPSPSSCFDSVNLASIIYDIHKLDGSVNTVTISPSGTETIAGYDRVVLSRRDENVEIATDGTNWLVRNRDRIYEGAKQTYKDSSVVIADVVVGNTTAETTLFSTSFAPDELRASDMIETVISGYYSSDNSSDIFTVRVKVNGVTMHSFVSVAKNVTDTPLEMTHKFTVREDGVTAATTGMVTFNAPNDGLAGASVVDSTIDTTITNSIEITMQWDSATVGNTGTIKQGICRVNG